MEFKDSRTKQNLMAAFAGESQARAKYTLYAAQAKQDGFEQIGDIFRETAENEQVHAELWFKRLRDGAMPSTADALKDAAGGEHFEWAEMYAEFARVAKEEGFDDLAAAFELVGKIEHAHEQRFQKLIENVETGAVFRRTSQTVWICLSCGHLHTGETPPAICPVCKKKQAYFALHIPNY